MDTKTRSLNLSVVFTSLLMIVAAAVPAAADTITLAWDPSLESSVIGYMVHIGTQSGNYTQHVDVGLSTVYGYSSAVAGQRYCFAVTAYVGGRLEGPRSNEVCGYSNATPVLINPGSQTSTVSLPTTLQLQGSDPMGQPVTYSATGLPPGLSLMSSTGFISGTPTTAGTFTVTARASDGVLQASQTFTWTITTQDATAPVVTIAGPTTAATHSTTASTLTLSGTASDNVGVASVSWVSDRGGSGTASGTTSWSVAGITLVSGSNVLTVTARDATGNTASDVITVTYNTSSGNSRPALAAVPNQTSRVGQAVSLQLVGSDVDNNPLTYSASGLPPGVTVGRTTGLITGAATAVGTYAVTVGAWDGQLSATRTFTWTVAAATATDTTPPAITITGPTSSATFSTTSSPLALSGTAGDNVGVVQVTWANNRGGSGTAAGTASWSVSGVALQGGSNVITVTARDAAGNTSTDSLTVTLGSTNAAPTLTNPGARTSGLGQSTSLQLLASDANGDLLAYSATGLPPGLSLTASSGIIGGTPLLTGTYPVTARVSDGTQTVTQSFIWTIASNASTATGTIRLAWDANREPGLAGYIVHIGVQPGVYARHDDVGLTTSRVFVDAIVGQRYCFAVSAYMSGAVEGPNSNEVCGTSSAPPVGDTTAPALTISGPTSAATFTTTASTLTLSGSASDNVGVTQVSWSSDRGASGTAAGTTSWNASGVTLSSGANVITVRARDAAGNSASDVITVTYNAPAANVAPTLGSVTNQSTGVGQSVSLQLAGSDANGDPLTYSASGLPPGISVGRTTGLITGAPTTAGTYAVTVGAYDGALSATRTFTWTVTSGTTSTGNVRPTLQAVANQTSYVGQSVSVQLVGADANNNLLTYSASGLPPGLSVGRTTGLITGRPTTRGTYTVTVGVYDGYLSATRVFTWTVQ